jgi:hypothetical protein
MLRTVWRLADDLGVSRSRPAVFGLAALLAAAALPLVLWHHTILVVASGFRLEAEYLVTGWSGFALIAFGLMLMTPVAVGNPRAEKAYMGWGVSLYVLGAVLAAQVAMAV